MITHKEETDRLSEDKLMQLFEDMHKADEIDKPIIREQIIMHTMKLVHFMVNKMRKTQNIQMEYDDMVSIGTIGLIDAVDRFDPDKGFKFSTLATICIQNEIKKAWYRKEIKRINDISLNKVLFCTNDNGNAFTVEDTLSISESETYKDLYQHDADEYNRILVSELMNALSDQERMIVTIYFGINSTQRKTQTEIALQIGVSQTSIYRILRQALTKMKCMADVKGVIYDG